MGLPPHSPGTTEGWHRRRVRNEGTREAGPGMEGSRSQCSRGSHLQEHDVVDKSFIIIVWVWEGSPHGDDLLGPLSFHDVVGPQGDIN